NAATTFTATPATGNGVSLTRDTDPATAAVAGPDGSGPASKTFVDANIALSPLTATNAVTQHHIVTATVKEDFGTGGGLVAADDAPVVFTITGSTANLQFTDPDLDGDNNPLTALTDANGHATLEF